MKGLGTIVNVAGVIIGSLIGLLMRGGISKRFQDIFMHALGLSSMFIGVAGTVKGLLYISGGALETRNSMLMIISMVAGAAVGEAINIENLLEQMGNSLKEKLKADSSKFTEGFVTVSLIICVGAMAVVGSLQDGLTGDASMLYAKSALDTVLAMIFASAMGVGVIFSALPLAVYQGGITLFATVIEPILTQEAISNLSFVGSLLIFGVGVNLCFGKKFKVGNMLPALIFAILLSFVKS